MACSPGFSQLCRLTFCASPSSASPIEGTEASATCISIKVVSGSSVSARRAARGSGLAANASLTCATSSTSRRRVPSPSISAQSAGAGASGSISKLGPVGAAGAASPPRPSVRATRRPERTMESSITMTVTVAPEMISTSWAVPPAAASGTRSSPRYASTMVCTRDSGMPISTMGSEWCTSRTPATLASLSTATSVWIGLPE